MITLIITNSFPRVKILIAGAGSIGSVLGVLLSSHHEVTLMRRRDAGLMRIAVTGVVEMEADLSIVSTCSEIQSLIIVSCQAHQTSSILPQLEPAVGSDTILLSLQNGVDNISEISRYFPNNRVFAGLVWWSATLIHPNLVYYHREATTVLDSRSGLCTILSPFNCEESDNIEAELYRKLVLNVVSPALALLKLPYPQGLNVHEVRELTRLMFEEACTIVSSLGIDLKVDRLRNFYDILLSGNIPSANPSKHLHKVSTQIGLEKHGGKGSNVGVLLGKLIELGSERAVVIRAVHDLILGLPSDYSSVPIEVLDGMLAMGRSYDIRDIIGYKI